MSCKWGKGGKKALCCVRQKYAAMLFYAIISFDILYFRLNSGEKVKRIIAIVLNELIDWLVLLALMGFISHICF